MRQPHLRLITTERTAGRGHDGIIPAEKTGPPAAGRNDVAEPGHWTAIWRGQLRLLDADERAWIAAGLWASDVPARPAAVPGQTTQDGVN